MSRNWAKWIRWPARIHNEDQAKIEEVNRAIKERRREPLPDGVDTSEREIVEMASVVSAHGYDPQRFLEILHQDASTFDVEPESVYATDDLSEEPRWPEGGFGLTMDELDWLADVCCDVAERADVSEDRQYEHDAPVERLQNLCEFLEYAREVGIPPSLVRGDQ